MCYLSPGPRCSKAAKSNLDEAEQDYKNDPSSENKEALKVAQEDYYVSPAGIESLKAEGKDKAAIAYQVKREHLIALSKEQEISNALANPEANPNTLHRIVSAGSQQEQIAAAGHPNISKRTLDYIIEKRDTDDFKLAVSRNPNATEEMIAWSADHPSNYVQNEALNNIKASPETIKKIASDAGKRYKAGDKENPQTKQAGGLWKKARTLMEVPSKERAVKYHDMADSAINRDGEFKQYYADTDKKHFQDKSKPGSKFTDPRVNDLNAVAALAAYQRGNLEGDDREKLIKAGANPKAFNDGFRYLIVRTPGKMGVQDISTFPPGTKFRVERHKAGGSCSIVGDVKEQRSVNYGVVIMGPVPGNKGDSVITAHPGMPSRSSGKDTFGPHEGRTLLASQVHEITGTDRVNINTRVV